MNRFEIKINYEKRIMKIESKSVSSLKYHSIYFALDYFIICILRAF